MLWEGVDEVGGSQDSDSLSSVGSCNWLTGNAKGPVFRNLEMINGVSVGCRVDIGLLE
jgi:hypothetical protein